MTLPTLKVIGLAGALISITAGVTMMAGARANAAPFVFRATGGDVAQTFADFQAAAGDPNNGNALGPIDEGRRQINWDAGIVPFDMPGLFFNEVVTRGAGFTSDPNDRFAVSNDGIDDKFNSFNPDYVNQFKTFSAPRLFTPVDSNQVTVGFFVSGTEILAEVTAFGAVFTDVDLPDLTRMEFLDADGEVLLDEFVDVASQDLSFLGADFGEETFSFVRITLGNAILGADDGNGQDVVVIDDLIYSEPQARAQVPEPATASLLLLGLGGLAFARRQKARAARMS